MSGGSRENFWPAAAIALMRACGPNLTTVMYQSYGRTSTPRRDEFARSTPPPDGNLVPLHQTRPVLTPRGPHATNRARQENAWTNPGKNWPSCRPTPTMRAPRPQKLAARYGQHSDRRGRCRRGARRRRLPAADAARDDGHRQADLRHEPRHHRLPDERVPRGRPARAHRGGAARDDPAAGDAGGDSARARRSRALAINEVALWRQSYQTAKIQHHDRRPGAPRRAVSATA